MFHLLIIISALFFNCLSTNYANKQLPLSMSTHNECIKLKSRENDEMQCENKGILSWLVTVNATPQGVSKVGYAMSEFLCRDGCLKSKDCLAINKRIDFLECKELPWIENTSAENNYDLLQLACCDKKPPKVASVQYTPYTQSVTDHACQPSNDRNECNHAVWVEIASTSVGSDIEVFYNVTFLHCLSICNKDSACLIFQFTDNATTTTQCVVKYSLGLVRSKQNPNIRTFQWYCCKSAIDLPIRNSVVCLRPEKQQFTNYGIRCEIGLAQLWVIETNVICQNQLGFILHVIVSSNSECQETCLGKKCSHYIYTKTNGKCLIFDKFDYCTLVNETQDYERGWLGCCNDLENYEFRPPKYSIVTEDCFSNNHNVIPYDGNLSLAKSSQSCQNWNIAKPWLRPEYFYENKNQHNYCRNVNNDINGPWCITSGSYQMEYCSLPKCDNFSIENGYFTKFYKCKSLKEKQCDTRVRHWVFLKRENVNICAKMNQLLFETDRIDEEEKCYFSCFFYPSCIHATYNRINNVCSFAKEMSRCHNDSIVNSAKLFCCFKEGFKLFCPTPLWFYSLMGGSYLLSISSIVFYFVLKKYWIKSKITNFPPSSLMRQLMNLEPANKQTKLKIVKDSFDENSRYICGTELSAGTQNGSAAESFIFE